MTPHNLPENLQKIRISKGVSQAEAARTLGFKRNTWSNWENGITQPTFEAISSMAKYFDIDPGVLVFGKVDDVHLIGQEGQAQNQGRSTPKRTPNGTPNRLLPPVGEPVVEYAKPASMVVFVNREMPAVVTTDRDGRENIVYVPIKAYAGYLLGYGDPDFIEKLQTFSLPGLRDGTYRMFEVKGQSMFNSIYDRDKVISKWVNPLEIKEGRVYVLITKEGILVKRCLNRLKKDGVIIAKSDNNLQTKEYPNFVVDLSDINEVWEVVERVTRQLPEPGEIYRRFHELEAGFTLLQRRLDAIEAR